MRRVLLVDDEEDILTSLKALFEAEVLKATVRTATRAQDALQVLASEPFALVITDYRMPGMDGLEFARKVRGRDPNVPIIMMTAVPDPTLAEKAKAAGVGLLIVKPFDLALVVGLVKGVIEGQGLPTSISHPRPRP